MAVEIEERSVARSPAVARAAPTADPVLVIWASAPEIDRFQIRGRMALIGRPGAESATTLSESESAV